MGRPFDSADAKKLIEKHSRLIKELSSAEQLYEALRSEITKAADALAEKEAQQVLKEIPIEEINRDKRGFRIKLLQDCGYNTIADISDVSVLTLERINGIGYEGAVQIKQVSPRQKAVLK